VGLAIGACAIALAVLALRARQRPWRLIALLGLFTSVPAGLAGAAFLAYHRDDLYSLLMSIGFLGALLSYGTGLYLKR
jgi:multisubunit Na+/H+ antiporter MnhB subunit